MLIRLGYDIRFFFPVRTPVVTLLHVHPSREKDLREPDSLVIEPHVPVDHYIDSFGNHCGRFVAPAGYLRLFSASLIEDPRTPDPINLSAREVPVEELPTDTLRFLLASRYCESDVLSNTAAQLFGHVPRGWERVQTIVDWAHNKITFDYNSARPTKTAVEVMNEGRGVCRDFQHLAITMCRCLNIPARYATGYMGDIDWVVPPAPMDFSAWFEAYLEDRWWTFDARNNKPRVGRVLMATGRDAADVALTTSFGQADLMQFTVVSDEVLQPPSVFNSSAAAF
ncbi:MAG TPA: transglutaminase family protein [Bryobacteraceae bacterium]|nr:transglutaminase family protein [Bryobacteraceae bacterium]